MIKNSKTGKVMGKRSFRKWFTSPVTTKDLMEMTKKKESK